jgi:PEP-CTERM motif
MKIRLVFLLLFVAVVFGWVVPVSALQISFLEPISPTANIAATTDIVGATITTSPELASVSATIVGVDLDSTLSRSVALREGSLTGPISDLLTVSLTTSGALTATFQSDTESPLTGTPLVNLVETGLPQLALSLDLDDVGLMITTQSDLDLAPVPEPSTLLLFGSSLAGMGGVLWRRVRHS